MANFRLAFPGSETGVFRSSAIDSSALSASNIGSTSAISNACTKNTTDRLAFLGIKTVIDLRGNNEKIQKTNSNQKWSTVSIDLIKGVKIHLLKTLPFGLVLESFTFVIQGRFEDAKRFLVRNSPMVKEGLFGLYKNLLLHSSKGIKDVFDVLADSNRYPVLMHCTAGKDRTGLLVCLLQLLIGLDVNTIASEYAKSESLFTPSQMRFIVSELDKQGLSSEFAKSPKSAILDVIGFIETKFGGVEQYLETIGVSLDQQTRVRDNILGFINSQPVNHSATANIEMNLIKSKL